MSLKGADPLFIIILALAFTVFLGAFLNPCFCVLSFLFSFFFFIMLPSLSFCGGLTLRRFFFLSLLIIGLASSP